MSNLEDLLETSSVPLREPKPNFHAEYRLPEQDEIITLNIRTVTSSQLAEWLDTMQHWEIQVEFLKLRDAYEDLLKKIPSTPTTGVIITADMLKDFTIYSGTNLKAFAIEKGTSLQTTTVLNKRIMKTEERAKIINEVVKIWRDPIRNHEDWNKFKRHLAYQFERLGMYPTVFIVNHNDRGEQLIKAWVDYFVSLIDAESEKDDKDIIRQVQDQESEILYHVLKASLQKDTNLNVHIQDARNPNSSVPRDVLGVYILAHGGERFTEMTVDSLIKTLMQNFTFFTRASRFKTFESWFLQYIEQTKRMIETHGDITFHHLMIANAILALDHMARYKNWMRNKRVEFPQRLSEIYGDAPKFLNGLLKDIRRLDATWVTHNDNPQVKLLPSQHQKSMITFLTNMLGVDLKEQQMITTPATFTTLKDDKGPCTYCKQDTHTWEQCRNRTQDHQLKKDVGSLHVSLNEQNRLLTKIAEKKVDDKNTQDILTKNLQALARLTIGGRKIQGTQAHKPTPPPTPQQKTAGGQQSFKENRNVGNVKGQNQSTPTPKFQPRTNVAMGAKTTPKAKSSTTQPPKDSKKQKFVGTMTMDDFDPEMLCFHTNENEDAEFDTMEFKPYSGNKSWLQKKLPNLTTSEWFTMSQQELTSDYEEGLLTSWEYSVGNDKLYDVMAGNGVFHKKSSPVWETRAPGYDVHLTDEDCYGRTADGELILHNHVEINCLYSAVLQLVCLRDQIVMYGGATPPTPKLAILQQFKGKGLQEYSTAFRQCIQNHVSHLSTTLGAKNKDLMSCKSNQSHTFRELTASFTPKDWEMYLAVSKHPKQPATLIEVAGMSDILGETIEIYRLTPKQSYQRYVTICPSEKDRVYEHKMPLKLFFHEEHYFGITPNYFGVMTKKLQLVTDKHYVMVKGGMMHLNTELHPKMSSQDLQQLQFRLHIMGANTYTRMNSIQLGHTTGTFIPLQIAMPEEVMQTILQESPLLKPNILRTETEMMTFLPRLAEVVTRMQTLVQDTVSNVSSEYSIMNTHSDFQSTTGESSIEIFKAHTYPVVERNYQLEKNIEEFMRMTGQNPDKKCTQLWESLSHKVDEYKQYLSDKTGHLTKTIPYPGLKFKFLNMHSLLDVSLDSIQLIIREKNLAKHVSATEKDTMRDFIQPLEIKNGTPISSPTQELFIDTLTAILVPDHQTVSPKQKEKLVQVSHKVQEIIQRSSPPLQDDSDDEKITIETIWRTPVLDLTTLTEQEVMNLCIHCLQAPKYMEPDGRIHQYCGKSCAISAGALPFPCMTETCPQCLSNPKWIEEDGRVRDYCGKTCAIKAGALREGNETISMLNPQPIGQVNAHQSDLQASSESLTRFFWKWKVTVIEYQIGHRYRAITWQEILRLQVKEAVMWRNMRIPHTSQPLEQTELFQSTSSSPRRTPSSGNSWYEWYDEETFDTIQNLHLQIRQLNEEKDDLQKRLNEVTDTFRNYKQEVIDSTKSLETDLEDKRYMIEQYTVDMRNISQQNDQLIYERNSLLLQVHDIQIEADMLKTENAILSDIKSRRVMAHKLAELEEQNSLVLETIDVKDAIIQTLQRDLADSNNARQTLRSDMEIKQLTYETALEALSDQNSDLHNQISMVTDRCHEILSKTLDESNNASMEDTEKHMTDQNKAYDLANNLFSLHHSQKDHMIQEIEKTLSNRDDIEEWMIGFHNISEVSLHAILDSFERIKAEFESFDMNATEMNKKDWLMNFQQTTFYQLVLMTVSMQDLQPYTAKILTPSQKLRTPRFTLDKPHHTFLQWIQNDFKEEPPYDSIEAYSYALKDHLDHIMVSKMTAHNCMLILEGQMKSIRLAIALFLVFKHKPAIVKGEAPFYMDFTMHTHHIDPHDMMMMMRRKHDYGETVIFRYKMKVWTTPNHLIDVLNQGETTVDSKIGIIYPPLTPNVTMDKMVVQQHTPRITTPCVKPKLQKPVPILCVKPQKTPKSILKTSEKQTYVSPAKEGAGVQSKSTSKHPWKWISAKIDTPIKPNETLLTPAKAIIHTPTTPTSHESTRVSKNNNSLSPNAYQHEKDSMLHTTPKLRTPTSAMDLKIPETDTKTLTPNTSLKHSASSTKKKSKQRRKSKKTEIENLVIEPQPNALTILGDALMNGIRTMSEKTRYPTRASKRS